MIFPWLFGIRYWRLTPMTWSLVALNIFFFVVFPQSKIGFQKTIENEMYNKRFLKVQAYQYRQFLKGKNKPEVQELFSYLSHKDDFREDDLWVAQASFRDRTFLESMSTLPAYPDGNLNQYWLKTWEHFKQLQGREVMSLFGVSTTGNKWTYYLTYQFIHSGFLHLFSNLMALIVFASALEILIGGTWVFAIYIIGGVAGALFYGEVSGLSIAPLIGASASVSALIGVYLIYEKRKNIPYFYFFTPWEHQHGEIYFSKWGIVPLIMINDLIGLLGTPVYAMSVAYAAHIGAALFGMAVGGVLCLLPHNFFKPLRILPSNS